MCHCRSRLSANKRIQRKGPDGEHAHGVWPTTEYHRWEPTLKWILAFGVQWLHESRARQGGPHGELILKWTFNPQRVGGLYRDLHADTMSLH